MTVHRPAIIGAALALAAGVLLLLAHLCRPIPTPSPMPTPAPAVRSEAIASSSAQVVASQSVRITITRHRARERQKPTHEDAPGGAFVGPQVLDDLPPGVSPEPSVGPSKGASPEPSNGADDETITLELTQGISGGATGTGAASAAVTIPNPPPGDGSTHGRLGVVAGTMPGVLAVDLEALRLELPRALVGIPLEIGGDLVGNQQAGAAGITLGGKAFLEGGAWSRWDLQDRGWMVGAGLRF